MSEGTLPTEARGDGPCMDCGTLDNPVWFTDNVTWNWVLGGDSARVDPGGLLCPVCFVARAHAAGLRPVSWRIYPEFARVAIPTVATPAGSAFEGEQA